MSDPTAATATPPTSPSSPAATHLGRLRSAAHNSNHGKAEGSVGATGFAAALAAITVSSEVPIAPGLGKAPALKSDPLIPTAPTAELPAIVPGRPAAIDTTSAASTTNDPTTNAQPAPLARKSGSKSPKDDVTDVMSADVAVTALIPAPQQLAPVPLPFPPVITKAGMTASSPSEVSSVASNRSGTDPSIAITNEPPVVFVLPKQSDINHQGPAAPRDVNPPEIASTATTKLVEAPAINTQTAVFTMSPNLLSPITTDVATPTTVATGTPASPSEHIAPVVIQLSAADGARHISLQLTPHALGRIDIEVDQPKTGPVTVQLTAEHPETLDMLKRDQAQLNQALDRAGVPSEHRVITFHVAAPAAEVATPQTAATSPTPTQASTSGGPGGSFSFGQSNGQASGQPGSDSSGSRKPQGLQQSAYSAAAEADAPEWSSAVQTNTARYSQRSTINITA